ncbi:hypothetical protein QTG56_01470 [Rossellomorea sp. AcN35-11]|nr:hypothetical protein [Rossellomorea aquimaris]WJV29865.1 hypothetical protein QTG56_01470 [Rossellomorea sp. AcN35-11]
MKIEIAKMERMSERGSSLLRLIQNSHTPVIDLLIRESIQNSLDAGIDSKTPVNFDISVKQFKNENASKHFEGIKEGLNRKFQDSTQESIVIRDSNTSGLTGPLHQDYIKDNRFGNLLKLIYEISMPQEKKEAGGSWGLGKTVYFRVGIGLVVYYSKVKLENGEYESRMAACLVEDESRDDALIPNHDGGLKRGIAWWGETHSGDSTRPLTNENEIIEILSDFNIEPYGEKETGTTIIIPFIDSKKLITKREDESNLWWHKSLELYLNIAVQRWYSARIDNELYPYGNYLKPSVNGVAINKSNMEPVFSILRSLYLAASVGKKITTEFVNSNDINVSDVEIFRTLKSNAAGRVAFVKINKEKLKMTVPNNKKSPHEYLDLDTSKDEYNTPVLAYLRKPGMVVSFETEGKWTTGVEKTADEYILAMFVPNSDNTVKTDEGSISLDEYLRQGEKADHSSWSDIMLDDRKLTIVERIQKRVAASIREAYNKEEKESNSSRSGALSKSLASALLPPAGFGKSPGGGSRKPGGGGATPRTRTGKLVITGNRIGENGNTVLDFEIIVPPKAETLYFEFLVDSEGSKNIKGNEWEDENEIGTPFPIEITKVVLSDGLEAEVQKTDRFRINNSAKVSVKEFNGKTKGQIYLVNNDPMVQASIQEQLV